MVTIFIIKVDMESPYYAPPHMDSSRPSLGFPLGTALLLIVIFSLSGIFSCCYHWEKIQALRRSSDLNPETGSYDASPSKPKSNHMHVKQKQKQSLPVIMPGDRIAKFIAMPCPCEPLRTEEKVTVEVQNPVKPERIAVPLY